MHAALYNILRCRMNAIHNQQAPKDNLSVNLEAEVQSRENELAINKFRNINSPAQTLLESHIIPHHPKAGLNPVADAAGYLFSVIGKLKQIKAYRQLSKLQKELMQEINTFQEVIKNNGYNSEYIIVCRYVICATFDDVIVNTSWGGQGQWDNYSLLASFNQDILHHDKFFNILERAVKEPTLYIDLMEFIYICLSMGYKGQYRSTEHSQYQLEQITNSLYKHIQAYRGSFSKMLSPMPLRLPRPNTITAPTKHSSPLFTFVVTACIIMIIFISLGYLMDVISNEAFKNLEQIKNPALRATSKQ